MAYKPPTIRCTIDGCGTWLLRLSPDQTRVVDNNGPVGPGRDAEPDDDGLPITDGLTVKCPRCNTEWRYLSGRWVAFDQHTTRLLRRTTRGVTDEV